MGLLDRFRKIPDLNCNEAELRGLGARLVDIIENAGLYESSGNLFSLELALDDVGWTQLGGGGGFGHFKAPARPDLVSRARHFATFNPPSKRAVSLYRAFILGDGISWRFDDEAAGVAGNAFWAHKGNRSIFSIDGLQENTDRLTVDGEFVVAVFEKGPRTGAVSQVRRIDPLEIKAFVRNPEDAGDVWGYQRVFVPAAGSVEKKLFYWDMFADPQEDQRTKVLKELEKDGFKEQDAVIRFAPQHGGRGVSLLAGAMDWAVAQTKFMEARSAIQQALARFAWKKKVKGGSAAVLSAVQAFASGLSSSGTGGGSANEDNPPPAPGSVYTSNEGVELTPIKTDTGAGGAQTDGDMLLQQFGMAVAIYPHWFGSGSNAKFSTSQAMELPMLKTMELEQAKWNDIYGDLMRFALTDAGIAEDKQGFEIIWPQIVPRDKPAIIASIAAAIQASPRLGQVAALDEILLSMTGVSDPAAALEGLAAIPPAAGSPSEEAAKLVEALNATVKVWKEADAA